MSSGQRSLNIWARKLHRWATPIIVIPLILVIISGLLLQVKKQSDWVQPPTKKAPAPSLSIDWDQILASAASAESAGIKTWDDVDRLDVRPSMGIAKVQGKNRWEVQIDTATGKVLHVAYRRSDFIESLHDGSFFGDIVKLGIFLPIALILLGLWLTGVWLWLIPHMAKRRTMKRENTVPG